MTQYPSWYFVWKIYAFLTVGCKVPCYNCVAVNIFLEVLQDFLYVFGCSYVGCIHIYNVYVFLVDSSFEYYEVTIWVSLYGPFFEVYFVWYEYCYPYFFFPVRLLGKFVSSPSLTVCIGLLSWGGSLVGSICVGHVFFLSIQLFYVFWLEHLIHLHLRLLSIGSYPLPLFPACVPLSFSFPSFP